MQARLDTVHDGYWGRRPARQTTDSGDLEALCWVMLARFMSDTKHNTTMCLNFNPNT